jgi:hypothetical protein
VVREIVMLADTNLPAEVVREIASRVAAELSVNGPQLSPWLTPKGAATYLRMSLRGLEDMRARGEGPKFSKVNTRLVRYHRADLDAWLQSNGGARG